MPKRWTARERRILASLKTPAHIQRYLDELEYDVGEGATSPRVVMRTGQAHCYGGALFACAALRELGHRPRLMFIDAVSDDGHCIALYQEGEVWGAVAKSNFTTIRSREPVYSYLALGLSYFDGFFNSWGKRTMRSSTTRRWRGNSIAASPAASAKPARPSSAPASSAPIRKGCGGGRSDRTSPSRRIRRACRRRHHARCRR
jgi:hypothetical protein